MKPFEFPETAVIHITERCTHNCSFCYAGKGLSLGDVADINILYRIMDKLSNLGVQNVCLLGGDPVKYPMISELLKYIKENTILKTTVMSNTFSPDFGTLEEISDYIDVAETTIHGFDSTTHDAHCGLEGAYNNLVDKLRVLLEKNVKLGVAVNLTPKTYDKIFDMISNFHKLLSANISHIIVQRIIPSGLAEDEDGYYLTKRQVNISLEQIDRINTELGIDIAIEDPFPMCVVDSKYHRFMHRCEWGISKFSLNADGRFSRCGATPNQTIGNILDNDFCEVWQNNPQLVEFRNMNYINEKCSECKYKNVCGGGCPLSNQINKLGYDYLMANEDLS